MDVKEEAIEQGAGQGAGQGGGQRSKAQLHTKRNAEAQPSAARELHHPFGSVRITANADGLLSVDWDQGNGDVIGEDTIFSESDVPKSAESNGAPKSQERDAQAEDVAEAAIRQVAEYLDGKRRSFDIPMVLRGTPFQQGVWTALLNIPYGTTQSYRDIAIAIDNPKGVRAVGQANRANHLPIVIPCHRVIGASGALTGYAGSKVHLKAALLELERKFMGSV
jgi:methylated-DNA-[protein]-cysteine S-methyltransferase